jgi:hypothetical protein
VCASRNCLAASITEDYFVLCDDDFVFGARTDFTEALRILRHYPQIGVVGGRLYDFDGGEEFTRHWELFLHLDSVNRTLTSTPIYYYAPRAMDMGTTRFYLCDAVMNFAVMRRAIFRKPTIRWDELFKSNGEHEDFFLNLKLNSPVRVVYLPTMVAYHHHPEEFVSYRSRLRDRLEGWKKFFSKWDIDQHLEVDLGVRTIDDFSQAIEPDDAKVRFFLNDNLSLRRDDDAAALLVGLGSKLNTVGILDEEGERYRSMPTMGRLLVEPASGRLMVGPDPAPPAAEALQIERESQETPQSRHSLVPSGPALDPIRAVQRVLFRYNPVRRLDADFVLWYRVAAAVGTQPMPQKVTSGTFIIHVRWFAEDGRVLMWEGSPTMLDASRTDYWAPLLVEVPVCPSDCSFMRFEVVAGEFAARRSLAIGFLFNVRPANPAANPGVTAPARDVLALIPWMVTTPGAVSAPANLEQMACAEADVGMSAELCAETPALMLLPISCLAGMDAIFVFGWPGLGAPLSIIPVPDAAASDTGNSAPRYVALPLNAVKSIRVIGYNIKAQGYREVALASH